MFKFSLANILVVLALCYFGFTAWSLVEVFFPRNCKDQSGCIVPGWDSEDKFRLDVYFSDDVEHNRESVITINELIISEGTLVQKNVTPPYRVYENGTVEARLVFGPINQPPTWTRDVHLVVHREPIRTAFNLLSNQNDTATKGEYSKPMNELPVAYWLTKLRFYVLKTPVSFSQSNVPTELAPHIFITRHGARSGYQPVIYVDPGIQKSSDWIPVPAPNLLSNGSKVYPPLEFSLSVEPLSIGAFRMRALLGSMSQQMQAFGLKQKDIDDVRQMLVDTNFYLLITTIFVAVFHMLFDFLAFKNDISFWRKTENTAGLSMRTVVWRFFSSLVIFLHLREEGSSFLIVIPMGISTCIELWKLTRITKMSFSFRHGFKWGVRSEAEQATDALDAQFMYWLICFMIPLCLAGSVYSLLYLPHRSWYSWCLQTIVNGVYAFGFLLMTPQLFLNYRLKSVAHLPWKALSYKAFNTFIDDFFAFIISMPTSHRIACLRDDIIFVIYLYQRWLYPVDKTRINEFGQKVSDVAHDEKQAKKER